VLFYIAEILLWHDIYFCDDHNYLSMSNCSLLFLWDIIYMITICHRCCLSWVKIYTV